MPGEEELPYDDFLSLIEDLSIPLPYSDATMLIFIDAVAFVMGGLAFLPPERRTAEEFLQGLAIAGGVRIRQAAGASSVEEFLDLLTRLHRRVSEYQHERMHDLGQPLPRCSLDPPCRFHPDVPAP